MLELLINDRGSEFEIVLSRGGHLSTHRVSAEHRTSIRELGDELRRILQRGWQHDGGNRLDDIELAETGSQLAEIVLSESMTQQLLERAYSPLRLTLPCDWLSVPWESLTMRGKPLHQWFGVGRTIQELRCRPLGGPMTSAPRVCIWANPGLDLLRAEQEGDVLVSLLRDADAGLRDTVKLIQNPMTRVEFLQTMQSVDWFHFAGHASQAEGQRTWQLADGTLTARDIDNLAGRLPRLIFANACGSADVDRIRGDLVKSLISGGVGNYVGLLTPVLDQQAIAFAHRFYAELLGGAQVGVALHHTLAHLRENEAWTDVACGNYVMYGEPSNRLLRPSHAPNRPSLVTTNPVSAAPSRRNTRQAIGPRDLQYPVQCLRCDRTIKTPLMVDSVLARDDGSMEIVCRRCSVPMAEPALSMVEASPSASLPVLTELTSELEKLPVIPTSITIPTAQNSPADMLSGNSIGTLPTEEGCDSWRHLLHGLGTPRELMDPLTGEKHTARWAPVCQISSCHRTYTLAPVDRKSSAFPQWQLDISLLNAADSGNPIATEELTEHLPTLLASPPRKSAGQARGGLARLWSRSASPVGSAHRFVVIVSETRWSDNTVKNLGVLQKTALGEDGTLVLVDLGRTDPWVSTVDLFGGSLTPFLVPEGRQQQIQRIIRHVRDLRPLATSLAAKQLATNLSVPLECVQIAFRNLAANESLHLDHVHPFGWVLSEVAE